MDFTAYKAAYKGLPCISKSTSDSWWEKLSAQMQSGSLFLNHLIQGFHQKLGYSGGRYLEGWMSRTVWTQLRHILPWRTSSAGWGVTGNNQHFNRTANVRQTLGYRIPGLLSGLSICLHCFHRHLEVAFVHVTEWTCRVLSKCPLPHHSIGLQRWHLPTHLLLCLISWKSLGTNHHSLFRRLLCKAQFTFQRIG